MIAPELAELIGNTASTPYGTVQGRLSALRGAKLFSVGTQGRFGAARMTDSDAANLFVATVIDKSYGKSIAAAVRCLRSLPLVDESRLDPAFAGELAFTRASNFGDALDALIADMRSGLYGRVEAVLPRLRLSVSIDSENGEASISLSREHADYGAGAWFYRSAAPHAALTWRQVHIRGEIFQELAAALGPPTPN